METFESRSKMKVLILGDGNFSFSLSLANHALGIQRNERDFGLCSNSSDRQNENYLKENNVFFGTKSRTYILYATTYDSKEVVFQDEQSVKNITCLSDFENVVILYDIDATNLVQHFHCSEKFNKVIFNFPHVGGKSNIRACRKLLENSFRSITHIIDNESEVLITLCRGQGGTPSDHLRNGYGNSWQVVTQAAKAGLILSNVVRFESVAPPDYEPAGYRGKLQYGFIKKDSLVHIFRKGVKISVQRQGIIAPSSENLISMVDRCYMNELDFFNPFESPVHAFCQCSAHLGKILEADYSLSSYQVTNNSHDIGKFNHLPDEEEKRKPFITTFDSWNPSEILMEGNCDSKVRYTSQLFVSSSISISPFSYPVYKEFVFLDGTSQFASLKEFISNLMASFQTVFQVHSLEMSWVTGKFNKNSTLELSQRKNEPFNVAVVPDFLYNIPLESWLSLEPKVTMSRRFEGVDCNCKKDNANQTSSLQYDKVAFTDYIMSEREQTYFCKGRPDRSFRSCIDNDLPICVLKINGIIVGEAGICKWQKNQKGESKNEIKLDYVAVFRIDLLSLAILQIDDIRLFWSKDENFQAHLRQCMANLERGSNLPCPRVMYPLCYRHDICFWVKDAESEDIFISAIRHCCSDTVHSIKLLRILRHEESELLSVCYRILYSRCDGPLSKQETVDLQNQLRLFLIDLEFDLR